MIRRGKSNNNYHSNTATALLAHGVTKLTTAPTLVKEEMIANTDIFIFDCDGVIWRVSSAR